MDFKSIISKIESIDGPIDLPKGAEQKEPVRLDEDTEFRVLAGLTPLTESIIMEKAVSKSQQQAAGAALAAKRGEGEAKGASKEMMKMSTKELEKFAGTKHKGLPDKVKKEDVEVSEELKKVGDTEKTHKGGTVTKTEKGIKHEKKDDYDGEDNSEPAQAKPSKAAKSAAEKKGDRELDKAEKAKSKDWQKRFGKDSVRKHSSESIEEASDKQKAAREKFLAMVDKKKGEKKEESVKEAKKSMKKDKKMDEAAKPDFLDMDKDGDKKEPMKKAVADKKKKTVKESVEQKLTFRDMAKLVQESGGQQAIDPLDKELFAWATRVAQTKLGEGMKAELYAGLVYERMGGVFEMYDVLSEDQK